MRVNTTHRRLSTEWRSILAESPFAYVICDEHLSRRLSFVDRKALQPADNKTG
jgi:hypothetical protein